MPAVLKVLMSPADSDNPFIRLFSAALRARSVEIAPLTNRAALGPAVDILLFHWPQNLATSKAFGTAWRSCTVMLARVLAQKLRGARLVWMVHNTQSSDRRNTDLERLYMRIFTGLLDGVIMLESTAPGIVAERLPALRDKPSVTARHPLFGDAYPAGPGRAAARARLGLPPDERVLGFVGDIRDYKNLQGLLQACREADGDRFHLFIAGALHRNASAGAVREGIGRLVVSGFPLVWLERRLDDEDLVAAIQACDVVALPYLEHGTINSGFAILALEHGARLLVSDTAPFAALKSEPGLPWVQAAPLPLRGCDVSAALKDPTFAPDSQARIERFRTSRTWDALADSTLELAARVTGATR
ncbi:hypothetical protein [Phenylobacterium sp.]|jgi:glycosyltransferase involved in cell wall biosynthesis|uniref:hypothetical protein n=1 Tax=Phenylobacterium sp. TaxID=1871053 RepID=UPI002F3EF495